jgi:hypothetical protein
MARSEVLKRIVKANGSVHNELRKDIGGKNLCERAEPQQRVLRGNLTRVRCVLAESAEKNLTVSHHDENHASGPRLKKEIFAQSPGGCNVRERWQWRLRDDTSEVQQQEERGKYCG